MLQAFDSFVLVVGVLGNPQATMAALLKKVKSQLQPITMQLKRLRDHHAPNYGSLHEWVVARHVAQVLNPNSKPPLNVRET